MLQRAISTCTVDCFLLKGSGELAKVLMGCINGVIDTSDACITSGIDTGEACITSINDAGEVVHHYWPVTTLVMHMYIADVVS
jgi:hypothetical protein